MSAERAEQRAIAARDERALHLYHDGELRGFARWRFERRLGRSPALRRELAVLGRIRGLVREADLAAAAPDLWDAIARRLPALDARRAEAEAARAPARLVRWLQPVGALAVAAATAALVFALWSSDNAEASVVRWIDSGGRNVVVLESDDAATIIWVLGDAAEVAAPGGGA